METDNRLCAPLGTITGPEDFALDRDWGRLGITQADRHGVEQGTAGPDGAIFSLDLKDPEAQPVKHTPLPAGRFFPHGLGLWRDPESGERRLFAVDHGPTYETHAIQIFQAQADGSLTHLETITDPLITRPNDVAPVGPRAFFTTNDLGGLTPALQAVEPYLLAPWSTLVHYDGQKGRYALRGLRYANGVTYDPARRRLYLAQVLDRSVTAYDVSGPGQLEKLWRRGVTMAVDNLAITAQGDVLAAGHPRPLAFTAHAQDLSLPSPSKVMQLAVDGQGQVQTLFIDKGRLYSGATVGQIVNDRLLIGSVYGRAMLDCRLAQNPS